MASYFSALSLPHALAGDEVFTLFQGSPERFVRYNVPACNYATPVGRIDYNRPYGRDLPWISPATPYMAMIPWNDPFHGPLFERLRFPGGYMPIVRIRRRWMLDPEITNSWYSLETWCRKAVIGMMNISKICFIPRLFHLQVMPERFGYRDTFRTRLEAEYTAMVSRNAFLPLMGALSLMSMIFQHLDIQGNLTFDWRERLATETGVHPAWISRLEDSVLFDLTEPRVGGIIRVEDWRGPDAALFPLFRRVNMPILLGWGRVKDEPYAPHYLIQENCVPSTLDIQRLHTQEARENFVRQVAGTSHNQPPRPAETPCCQPPQPSSVPLCQPPRPAETPRCQPPQAAEVPGHQPAPAHTPTPEPAPAVPEPLLPFPPVERYSGQRPGETIEQFFRRRAEGNSRVIQRETARERQSREAKERNAARQTCPGRAGATVFIWERVDGYRIRKAAGRRNYDHFWDMYQPTQRRYDGFRNEWDLCSEFDPSAEDEDSDGSDSSGGGDDGDDDDDEPLPPYSPPPPPCETDAVGDLMYDLANTRDDGPLLEANPDIPVENLDEVAYNRFGFQEEYPLLSGPTDLAWEVVCRLLGEGCGTSRQGVMSQEMQRSLSTFFGHLSTCKTVADIPTASYDINQTTSDITCLPHNIKVSIIEGVPLHYVLVPCNLHESPFFVVIKSPATVVEIIRRIWDRDVMSMVQELLKRCIPFQLCVPGPHRHNMMPKSIPSVSSLGRRKQKSKFDETDFLLYERLHDEFFHSSRGHLALLAGGIIARLAREVIPFSKVYDGPADNVEKDGIFICKDNSGSGYYSDVLSDAEVNLILGVYHVETIQRGDTLQTQQLSWWPKRFDMSGLWAGYWTPSCENWFNTQLQRYKTPGPQTLRTTQQWKDALRFHPRVRKVFNHHEALLGQWLESSPRRAPLLSG